MILFIGPSFRGALGIVWLILMIYALLQVIKSNVPTNTKLLWIIVIVVAPVIGSLIYLLWGKDNRL
jgi:hypothetical protein